MSTVLITGLRQNVLFPTNSTFRYILFLFVRRFQRGQNSQQYYKIKKKRKQRETLLRLQNNSTNNRSL